MFNMYTSLIICMYFVSVILKSNDRRAYEPVDDRSISQAKIRKNTINIIHAFKC